jgi:hypothetical protein
MEPVLERQLRRNDHRGGEGADLGEVALARHQRECGRTGDHAEEQQGLERLEPPDLSQIENGEVRSSWLLIVRSQVSAIPGLTAG